VVADTGADRNAREDGETHEEGPEYAEEDAAARRRDPAAEALDYWSRR
jgi:hypothetical protein